MPDRWLGVVVGSEKVTVVDVTVPAKGPIIIQGDHSWPLQRGERPAAYRVMHQQLGDYAREHGIVRAIVKGSALSRGGTKQAHLEAAELRGVVLAALSDVTETSIASKAHISRTFGNRKVDEYLKDDAFWKANVTGGNLRNGSREAAMVLVAGRSK
jgi:hypothetical protein